MNTQNETAAVAQVPPLAVFESQASEITEAQADSVSPVLEYFITLCNKKGIKPLVKYKKVVIKFATVQEANQYFFEVVLPEKDTAIDDLELLKDNPYFKNKLFQNERDRQINSLVAGIADARNQASNYMKEADKYLQRIGQYSLEREVLLNKPEESETRLFEDIKKVTQSGFFVFDEVASFKNAGYAYFKTKPVFLSFRDVAAGIDIKDCPMGSYTVQLNLSGCGVIVMGGAKVLHGHRHPHVGSSGGICWGNAKDAYLKAVERRDIVTILGLVHSVLSIYNAGSPYVSLIDYDVAQNPNKYPLIYKQEGTTTLYFNTEQTNEQREALFSFFGQAGIEKLGYYDDSEGDNRSYYKEDRPSEQWNTWIDDLELTFDGDSYLDFIRVPIYYGCRGSSKVTSALYKNQSGEYLELTNELKTQWGLS